MKSVLKNWIVVLNQSLTLLHNHMVEVKIQEVLQADRKVSGDVGFKTNDGQLESGCGETGDPKSSKVNNSFQLNEPMPAIEDLEDEEPPTSNEEIVDVTSVSDHSESGYVKETDQIIPLSPIYVTFNSFNVIYGYDPFLLPPEILKQASELVQLCFVSGIYGNISLYVSPSLAEYKGQTIVMDKISSISDCSKFSDNCDKKSSDCDQTKLNYCVPGLRTKSFDEVICVHLDHSENGVVMKDVKGEQEDIPINCENMQENGIESYSPASRNCLEESNQKGTTIDSSLVEDVPKDQELPEMCLFIQTYCYLLNLQTVRQNILCLPTELLFPAWNSFVRCAHSKLF